MVLLNHCIYSNFWSFFQFSNKFERVTCIFITYPWNKPFQHTILQKRERHLFRVKRLYHQKLPNGKALYGTLFGELCSKNQSRLKSLDPSTSGMLALSPNRGGISFSSSCFKCERESYFWNLNYFPRNSEKFKKCQKLKKIDFFKTIILHRVINNY